MESEPASPSVAWAPREARKLNSLLDTRRGGTWWAPGAAGWWIGILFALGAACFALGAAPGYVQAVGNSADAITFFIGSIFFTSAATLQFLEAVNVRREELHAEHKQRLRLLALEPRSFAWWACLVQLAGTIYFNVSTCMAINSTLSAPQVDKLVWKPDAFGSICFVIASILAWLELGRAARASRPRSLSWWIVYLNFAGSFAFGVSALASYIVPTTGNDVNKMLVNLGTFVGAVCFFAGALLLLPERTREKLD
jgi:uncharacterized membrane protein